MIYKEKISIIEITLNDTPLTSLNAQTNRLESLVKENNKTVKGTILRANFEKTLKQAVAAGEVMKAYKIESKDADKRKTAYVFESKDKFEFNRTIVIPPKNGFMGSDQVMLEELTGSVIKVNMTPPQKKKSKHIIAKAALVGMAMFGTIQAVPIVAEKVQEVMFEKNFEYHVNQFKEIKRSINEFYANKPLSNMNFLGIVYHTPEEEAKVMNQFYINLTTKMNELKGTKDEISQNIGDIWTRFNMLVDGKEATLTREEKEDVMKYIDLLFESYVEAENSIRYNQNRK